MVRERDVSMYEDGNASVPETIVIDSSGSSPEPATRAKRKSKRVVEVDMPALSSSDKEAYEALHTPKSVLDEPGADEGARPTKIMAEHRVRTELFYYVLHDDNVVRKLPAGDIKKDHKDLVNAYETAKDDDALEPFDFEDARIEQKSRLTHIRIQRPAKTDTPVKPDGKDALPAAKGKREYRETDDESSESSSAEEVDSDYEQQASPERPQRRSTRRAAAPFGPKSKVAKKADSPVKKTRASARERKNVSYGAMMEQSDSDIEMLEEAPAPKEKRSTRPKKKVLSRPAYGNIRHVSELSDPEDDDRDRLRAHRMHCEKCLEKAAHLQLAEHRIKKRRKVRGKRKSAPNSDDDDENLSEGEMDFEALGGWVRCLKCCVVSHWKCLGVGQREEVLRAVREKDAAQADGPPREKRKKLDLFETTEFVCAACSKGGICMICKEVVAEKFEQQVSTLEAPKEDGNGDVEMADASAASNGAQKSAAADGGCLLFRCVTCKRPAHYEHLAVEDASDVQEIAIYYQDEKNWQCDDCLSFTYPLECILAWRPYPSDAVEQPVPPDTMIDVKRMLPREYLVKWQDRSYKRVQWVPHGWLVTAAPAKLKNFVNGTKISPLPAGTASGAASKAPTPGLEDELGRASPALSDDIGEREYGPPPASDKAETRIPRSWCTVDRVLDVKLWCPPGCGKNAGGKKANRQSGKRVVDDDEDDDDEAASDSNEDSRLAEALHTARVDGEEPDTRMLKSIPEWEKRHGREITEDDIHLVVWGYFKWFDLTYDQCTWEAPPEEGDDTYPAFKRAFQRFLASRKVEVKIKRSAHKDPKFQAIEGQPNLCKDESLALRGFQIDGINWLYFNWHNGQSSILADEMGLGKTVQMTTLIAYLVAKHDAVPFLVVVPNSTLSNWLREFERWAPDVVVVPFFGDAKSRDIVKQYEMYHDVPPKGCTQTRFHVLLSSYESITSTNSFSTFKQVKKWEGIVVDEGQRLKSDSSLLFRRLTELDAVNRILMTGTPLNNNIRELFNLMNFLDPKAWNDLTELEERYKVLTEESISELHEKLKPYFLRRTKADVLTLPPKNELIVPVTMSPLQKTVYKSVIGQNAELLQSLLRGGKGTKTTKSKLSNILMQLRKCIQHPYLVDPELEPRDVPPKDMHKNLVDASAKLQLLKTMLPQLKARGHRVLLFSQFRIALNIIEDFLVAEGHTFRRLDGMTKQADRQKYMDEFNAEGSDVFVFMLSTRAGGVGINLYTADTVIIFDPDYNPHNDLQAIARSHRFGQTKTVLVFKLMMKDSAEEKIMQAGKKKLALDHLIVQTMDDEDGAGDDVQTLLTFGAKALFEDENSAQSITYSPHDVEQLIVRTETAVDVEKEEVKKGGLSFEFAKIWLPSKGAVEDVPEEATEAEDGDRDFWAEALAKATAEQEAAQEKARQQLGRGARRRKEVNYAVDRSPEKVDKKGKGRRSGVTTDDDDDVDFLMPAAIRSDSDSDAASVYGEAYDLDGEPSHPVRGLAAPDAPVPTHLATGTHPPNTVDIPAAPVMPPKKTKKRKLAEQENLAEGLEACGLCHQKHGPKACFMTENSANLLEYRKLLFDNNNDEPYETRAAAVRIIDRHLNMRGHSLRGLPHFPPPPEPLPLEPKVKKRKTDPAAPALVNGEVPKPAVLSDAIVNTPALDAAPPAPFVSSAVRKTTAAKVPPTSSPYTTVPSQPPALSRPSAPEHATRDLKVSAELGPVSSPPIASNPAFRSSTRPAEEPPRARLSLPSSSSTSSAKPVAQSSMNTGASAPGMRQTTLSFGRKDNKGNADQCPVCDLTPSHAVVRCPVVQQGTESIRNAINRLNGKPGMESTLTLLRQVLAERTVIHKSGSVGGSSSAQPMLSKPVVPPNPPPPTSTNPAMRRKSNPKPIPMEEDVIVISD